MGIIGELQYPLIRAAPFASIFMLYALLCLGLMEAGSSHSRRRHETCVTERDRKVNRRLTDEGGTRVLLAKRALVC